MAFQAYIHGTGEAGIAGCQGLMTTSTGEAEIGGLQEIVSQISLIQEPCVPVRDVVSK